MLLGSLNSAGGTNATLPRFEKKAPPSRCGRISQDETSPHRKLQHSQSKRAEECFRLLSFLEEEDSVVALLSVKVSK